MAASESRSSARVAPRSVSRDAITSAMISSTVLASGLDGAGARPVPDGPVAHGQRLQRLRAARPAPRALGQPHPVPAEHLALVRVVDRGQLDVLPLDVAPDVQLGPVGDREHPHVLAGRVPPVVEVPQLRPLGARVPAAERVAQRDDPLLGPGPLLVPAAAAEHRVEAVFVDRVQQRHGLQRVAGAVGPLDQAAVVDPVLDVRHLQAQPEPLDQPVPEVDHLRVVVPGVHVQQRERHRGRRERLDRQVHQQRRVLAPGEQDHRPVELAGHLAEDVDRLRLQRVERVQRRGGHEVCSPHSILPVPAQRPLRLSAPGAGFAVHGAQPMLG